ncbi:peptidoglycan D,D-transpeptidase FtsI family protein [Sulfurovum sp. NBC37-1]|uniref:peptidoglycan D,D-transpeptidase FtsI family protein n=1 Tax=Sulfurovum sp. (strain NBC37-1) TaxID=387093 RepID=UPI00015876BA|nr:penicillin-binding protein 2 [Sulfurovum sp. NBC37-1]BAF71279.1 cell division protein FtsI [Sulfurovum sp. NBC37-1]
MNKNIENLALHQRKNKISFLFILLVAAMAIFLFSVLKTILSHRHIPSQYTIVHDRSLRGDIVSADNYTLSRSQKTYQAVIHGASIDPAKRKAFVRLFSIYSGIPKEDVLKKFKDKKGKDIQGNIVLAKDINFKSAMQLKELAYKLRKLGAFKTTKTSSGIEVLYGLDIVENGETREFPLKDVLSPVLGYVRNRNEDRYSRPHGIKGLERKYEKHITSKKNGYFKGERDVVASVIHNKNSIDMLRVDGMDLHLNVPLAFQRRVEMMIDQMKTSIDADEILAGVMESKTGKVLALASTERYDPRHIHNKDISALDPKFSEYAYEAGSVLKPITLGIALDHKVVTPNTWFNTYNGRLQIGKRRWISDDEKFDSLTATDIIVHSSNVGISQISWRLTGQEFRDGLIKFGLSRPSGLDLSRDVPGRIKPLHLLNNKMHRANSSYGYGMLVTFAQLFKAYSAFNNDGVAVTPRLVDYLSDAKGSHYTLEPKVGDLKAVDKQAARQIHNILLEVVKRGTGVKAQYPGLEIGGKTGTAHIAKGGRYVREYHSSFYGFANDKEGHKYTIGVLVIRAKKYHKYFASQSAVPTFRRIVDTLVELDYLKPEGGKTDALAPIKLNKPKEMNGTSPERREVKNPSINKLFKMKPKPKPKPKKKCKVKPKPKPKSPVKKPFTKEKIEEMSAEDLF